MARSKTIEPEKTAECKNEESGILCPDCRYPLRVYKTKKLTGEIARERICDRCRKKVETVEVELAG